MLEPVSILEMFIEFGEGLKFTLETREKGKWLQFLDLRLWLKNGLCWSYMQRSSKPLLPFNSYHAKKIKNAIVTNAITQSVKKACPEELTNSLEFQEMRLKEAGYPDNLIQSRKKKLLLKEQKTLENSDREVKRYVGIPYVHKFTSDFGNTTKLFDLEVASTYGSKIDNLPKKLIKWYEENDSKKKKTNVCKNKDIAPNLDCAKNVVYQFDMDCGKATYIGETGECGHVRIAQHETMKAENSNVTKHAKKHKCKVKGSSTKYRVKRKIRGTYTRKLIETIEMEKFSLENSKMELLSEPSIQPTTEERRLLASM
jgi:hypothetical protein